MKDLDKQIQAAARKYVKAQYKNVIDDTIDENTQIEDIECISINSDYNGFVSGANFGIELAQQWIDVKEELPEGLGKVLVKVELKIHMGTDKKVVYTCGMYKDQWLLDHNYNTSIVVDDVKITHWKPIGIEELPTHNKK